MNPSPPCYWIVVLLLLAPGVNAAGIAWGPISLHDGQHLELCTHARRTGVDYATNQRTRAQFTYVRIRDGKTLRKEFTVDASRGGCTIMPYDKLGGEPIFTLLEHNGPIVDQPLLVSVALVGTHYQMLTAQVLDGTQPHSTRTVYGPLRLGNTSNTDGAQNTERDSERRLRVCTHNHDPENPATVSIAIYSTRYANRPLFERQERQLEPGKGSCVTVSEARVGDHSIFAEIRSESRSMGGSNSLMSGATIVGTDYHQPVPANKMQGLLLHKPDRSYSGRDENSPYREFYRP